MNHARCTLVMLAVILGALDWAGRASADPIRFTFGTFDRAGAMSPGSATEPSIAVGPNHVFAQEQGDVKIFTKDGQTVYSNCPRGFL